MHLADEIIPTYGWYPPGVFGGVIGNSAHNIWLNTAATTGTLGVLAVFMLFAVYWHTARQRMHKLRWAIDQRYRYVVRGCMVGLVAFFVRTQFEEPGMLRGAIAENLLFWLTFVIVLTSQNLVKPTLVEVSNEV